MSAAGFQTRDRAARLAWWGRRIVAQTWSALGCARAPQEGASWTVQWEDVTRGKLLPTALCPLPSAAAELFCCFHFPLPLVLKPSYKTQQISAKDLFPPQRRSLLEPHFTKRGIYAKHGRSPTSTVWQRPSRCCSGRTSNTFPTHEVDFTSRWE